MIRHRACARLRATLLPCLLLVCSVALGASGITAVPPAANRAMGNEKAMSTKMALPSTAPALRIVLPAATESESAIVRAKNAARPKSSKDAAKGTKGRPLAIGFGRPIPAASQTVTLESLQWQVFADGSRGARIEVVSPAAAALRIAMVLPATDPDLSVRFAGNAPTAQVFGPIPANTIAEETARSGVFWSPALDGDVATIELQAGPGVKVDGIKLTIPRVAHHLVAGAALKVAAKTVGDIGRSDACEIDVACVQPQTTAFVNATKAVAEILFTQENGTSYLCTGTLINDATASNTPYFYTGNHCINSDLAARTMNTYWFFDAVACGSTTVPAFVQQTAGAALLARSEDWDWALVRLNQAPPAGAYFSAWRADNNIPLIGATISVIHHPQGDLKKWAQGLSPGYQTYSDGTSFIQARYSQGTTEGGSSGAGLFTFNSTSGFYELRGGLFGGDASCSDSSGIDVYSRLDNLLPLARQYLTPGSNPSGTVVAVEFYNATLQHYFLSTNPGEINDLDTGVHVGWVRTGFRFLAYATQVGGTNPVCRFYRDPHIGDSHYYSASPAECASTAAKYPDWIYEAPNVFYIQLPDTFTGNCPSGTLPIWRFFNQVTTNHRYTADQATRDDMLASPSIWLPDGYGPGPALTAMCTPVGS